MRPVALGALLGRLRAGEICRAASPPGLQTWLLTWEPRGCGKESVSPEGDGSPALCCALGWVRGEPQTLEEETLKGPRNRICRARQ